MDVSAYIHTGGKSFHSDPSQPCDVLRRKFQNWAPFISAHKSRFEIRKSHELLGGRATNLLRPGSNVQGV